MCICIGKWLLKSFFGERPCMDQSILLVQTAFNIGKKQIFVVQGFAIKV